MQTSKATFMLALEHYPGSVIITDQNLKIVYANQNSAKLLETTTEHLLTLNIHQMLREGLIDKSCAHKVRQTKKPYYSPIRTKYGYILYAYSSPHLNADGKLEFIVTYCHNEPFFQQPGSAFSPPPIAAPTPADLDPIMESAAAKQVFHLAAQVAASDAAVMLFGESGVGKEVVAKYIYDHSRRKDAPFVAVNCAAIPESLMESEFFGYEAGSFTGALRNGKPGLFELANNGTLFLDEVGEMSLSIQSKLLRVLESRRFRRIGGETDLPANVRVIAATNRNLRQMVKEKTFRSDLYYRLNIIPIEIPPLRQRQEDVLALSQRFLSQMDRAYSTHKSLSQQLTSYILHYHWPGNVRELKNFIERLYVISPGDTLQLTSDMPPPAAPLSPAPQASPANAPSPEYATGQTLKDAVSDFERTYISAVLERCGYNMSQAAKLLDMHRTSLYQKLQKYHIERK